MVTAQQVGSWIEGKGRIYVPLAAVVAVTVATYVNITNQTAVAIDVARQHGEELRMLREDYTQLHGEMRAILDRLEKSSDDRFRGRDAVAMEQRIMERVRMVESSVAGYHKNGK